MAQGKTTIVITRNGIPIKEAEIVKIDINKIIADHCGWTEEIPPTSGLLLPYRYYHPFSKKKALDLPDYQNDLNAIHDAEMQFIDELAKKKHWLTLSDALEKAGDKRMIGHWHASANIRAYAFIKSLCFDKIPTELEWKYYDSN